MCLRECQHLLSTVIEAEPLPLETDHKPQANVDNIFSQTSKRSYSLNHLLDDKRARKAVVKTQYLQKVYGFLERHYSVLNSGVFERIIAKRVEFDITRQRCELLLLDRLDKSRKLSKAQEAEIVSKVYHVLLVSRHGSSPKQLWTAMYRTLVQDGACLPACHFYNLEPELRANLGGRRKKKLRLSRRLKLKDTADLINEGEQEEEQREVAEKEEEPETVEQPKGKAAKPSKKSRKVEDSTEGDEEDTSVVAEPEPEDSKSAKRSKKKRAKEAKKQEKKEAKEQAKKVKTDAAQADQPSPLQTLLSNAAQRPAPSTVPKKKSRGAFRSVLSRKKVATPQRHAVMGGGLHVSSSSVLEDGSKGVEFAGESSDEE